MRIRLGRVAAGFVGTAIGLAAWWALMQSAPACPFCSAAMQTLSQEIAGADGAVIAQLVEPMPALPPGAAAPVGVDPAASAAKFRIVEVLRGQEKLAGAEQIEVVYFGQDSPDKRFLITGLAAITPDKIEWTTPVPLSERAVEYVRRLPGLPEKGVERLTFFQEHLEDEDPLLAQDSYDEFARAPYAEIIALGPHMKRNRLLAWINDPMVGPSGRRLYLTMLGVCGQPEDVAMLEELLTYDYQLMKPGIAAAIAASSAAGISPGMGMIDEMIHAEERRKKESLDALIACYLKLKGPAGLELINKEFLGNPNVEYKHLHSAIMALRFHGEETDILPREKLLESMRLALDHKEFADQVLPDLTRWEDWEVMPRLVGMFKDSPADDWIRQPVASYMLVAAEQPGEVGERAKAALAELEQIDGETVERARSLSAFSFLAQAAASPASPGAASPPSPGAAVATASATNAAPTGAAPAAAAGIDPATASAPAAATVANPPAAGPVPPKDGDDPAGAAAAAKSAPPAAPIADAPLQTPTRLKIIGVPLLAAVVLLAVFAVLLRGTDPRSSEESPNG